MPLAEKGTVPEDALCPCEVESILGLIDKDTAKSIPELADETGLTWREVRAGLAELMNRGRITSTPDWKYRESRRTNGEEVGGGD